MVFFKLSQSENFIWIEISNSEYHVIVVPATGVRGKYSVGFVGEPLCRKSKLEFGPS